MKARVFFIGLGFIFLFFLLPPLPAVSQEIPLIVSTEWLEKNLDRAGLVILDVRRVEDFREGHIPGAVNLFYRAWAFKKDHLYAELPEKDDLFEMIGSAGILPQSTVVVVGTIGNLWELVHSARVACTLRYAGVKTVAILDGGFDKWKRDGLQVTTDIKEVTAVTFQGTITTDMIADEQYILSHWGKILLLDVREQEYYLGERKMDCVERPGRIPGAVNLPTSWVFTDEGTYAEKTHLAFLVERVVGKDRNRNIVTYCDTGQCCPTWALILKEMLGYRHVRIYDGGLQEWMSDPNVPWE